MEPTDRKFVIQEHSKLNQPTHWDLMLETEDVLQTWRLDKKPTKDTCDIYAERIPDHDKKFLTYEGPVNKGLGSVRIIDSGNFRIVQESGDRIVIFFEGNILCKTFGLSRSEYGSWIFSIFNNQY